MNDRNYPTALLSRRLMLRQAGAGFGALALTAVLSD
jgi:hypothetical protein